MNNQTEPLLVFKPREIRTAGHTHSLWANSPWSMCGPIDGGVGVCFQAADGSFQGSWVIDFEDLKELVADVEAWQQQRDRSVAPLPHP